MKDGELYFKTEAGKREIQDRALRLPAALRSILLMVDGQRDQEQLRELMTGLRAPDDAIEQLVVKGLIQRGDAGPSAAPVVEAPAEAPAKAVAHAPVQAQARVETPVQVPATDLPALPGAISMPADFGNYRRLYNFVTDAVSRHLGLKGYFMQLKVERCSDVDALLDLLPEVATALTKAKDHTFASEWLVRARAEVRS
ncbi:hypothetical protein CSC74_14825 [Pseudoxanthomonas yeongjuensis]|uniref:hypothetical protein n=1 Tax=Pseudoxanthomonas yeongjuensis TaxID=377616 RepID=UPI00139177AE|nr:hypothetical protein [Pseudoxanthomonas yeongjuensis]KAF1714912.1 hypothetical protein CSC74_14825 [Pseudoxanthomonas yeongjuensis]